MCVLVVDGEGGVVQVMLDILSGDGVLDADNEVDLVGRPTLVRPEHDRVAGVVLEVSRSPPSLLQLEKRLGIEYRITKR